MNCHTIYSKSNSKLNKWMKCIYWLVIELLTTHFYSAYSAVKKFGISKILYVFWRSFLCSSRLHLFDQKYRKKM